MRLGAHLIRLVVQDRLEQVVEDSEAKRICAVDSRLRNELVNPACPKGSGGRTFETSKTASGSSLFSCERRTRQYRLTDSQSVRSAHISDTVYNWRIREDMYERMQSERADEAGGWEGQPSRETQGTTRPSGLIRPTLRFYQLFKPEQC